MGFCMHIDGVVCSNCIDIRKRNTLPSIPYISPCNHCYCIHIGISTRQTVPHNKCCKCGDVRAASGSITFS